MQKLSRGIRGCVLKVILLMIFSLYTCSISFFTHTHIVGGVTIVHSHFYGVDAEGNPTHEHTGAEIQLIQNLSTYFALATVVLAILVGLMPNRSAILFVNPDCFFRQLHSQTRFRLRAPPVL